MVAPEVVSNSDLKGENADSSVMPLISLKVLPVLKERQQQHGLRHGDFQRYHGYCSRRLRRLRETLHLPQGDRRHFKRKDISVAEIDAEKADSRFLEIPLTVVERAWACAMELKQEANTEPRKRFHMISRLRKALKYSEDLMKIAQESTRVDARTKLEIEAYVSFINASFHFEMEQWEEAMTAYKKTQSIYTQIAQALGEHPESALYTEKTSEILPAMRFCAYKTGAELKISELSSEFQSAAIQDMIAQRPKMSEITFRKNKIIVPTEKIAALLVRIDEFDKKQDKKVEMYEEILVDLRDAIQSIRDMVKIEQQQTGKSKPSWLLSNLLYLRLKLTISRTELMMQEKNQPKDCTRLVEIILHNLAEMKTIQLLDADEDFQLEVDDQISVFKGVRCRYLADALKTGKRWGESLALYEKTNEHFRRAQKGMRIEVTDIASSLLSLIDNIGLPADSPCHDVIKRTLAYTESAVLESHAQAILTRLNPDEKDKQEAALKLTRPEEPLIDRLEEFVLDESLVSGEPNVAPFPPDYKPVPCKPLFFDLALNHIQYPQDEVQEQAGASTKKSPAAGGASGLTGFVKGLWGWGGK